MAIKCLHSNHSHADEQQQKCQKIQAEEIAEAKGLKNNGMSLETDTFNLVHLKHDWYDKGDAIAIHVYIKCIHEKLLDVILYEDELHLEFATSNKEFLKMYPGTSECTLFSWNLRLRGKVKLTESSCRVAKAYLDLSLKKTSSVRWTGLEQPNIPGLKKATPPSDRPFRQLFAHKNKPLVSSSRTKLTNGVCSNNDSCDGQKPKLIPCEESAKSASHSKDEKDAVESSLEEKHVFEGDSLVAGSSVSPSSIVQGSTDSTRDSCCSPGLETACASECIPQDIDDLSQVNNAKISLEPDLESKQVDFRTSDSSSTVCGVGTLPVATVLEDSGFNQLSTSGCKYTMAAATSENLTVTYSSLSTSVQSSISTSTSSTAPALELTSLSSSGVAIPVPPPPPSQVPGLQRCGDAQVKTGMMGGSRSKTTDLPFSEAIRAAASKGSDCYSYAGSGPVAEESLEDLDPSGLTGLENLGNTCYLNSIVQCLANTRQLRDFFLADKYKEDINTENPLGTGGRLAVIFANVMRTLWSGKERSLSPHKLKGIVGDKVCQFKGFMQQDAQEFMAFLLDGLHEDLNRVKEKPYVEEVEGAGKPDIEVANEAWRRYKSRNDSIIVDQFQGQLKSKLTCPVCKKISIKYDPFMNLSVPLPKEVKPLPVFVFFKNCEKIPLKIIVQVTQDASVEQLMSAVEHKTGIQPENMRVYEVFSGKFHKPFPQGSSLSTVVSSDIITVYEMLSEEEAGEKVYEIPIMQRLVCPSVVPIQCASCYKRPGPSEDLKRCTQCWGIGYCNQKCQKDHWSIHKRSCKRVPQPVGIPFIISVPASKATFKHLQYLAEEYAKYSVEVHVGDSGQNASPTKGECSYDGNGATSYTSMEGTGTESSPCTSGRSKDSFPRFYFKPLTAHGEVLLGDDGTRLKDEGRQPLNLSGKYLSIDWRNHPRTTGFVVVEEKDYLDCEEHPSCNTEAIKESYSCSLEECLELFTEPETLSENDAWYCPQCKTHREATKQLSVWRLPEILIIHLKRFSFRNILFKDKITKLVDFPLKRLDMSRFTLGRDDDKEGSLYDLFAVANHSGTVNFGHYTAFARLAEADTPVNGLKRDGLGWRYFDDRNVTETSDHRVVSKYAYVLFYKRRPTTPVVPTELHPEAVPTETKLPEEKTKASPEDVDENELD